jgi:hypothetical protein
MSAHHGKGSVSSLNSAYGRDLRRNGCRQMIYLAIRATRAEQVALKTELLAKHHQDVFSAMPNTNAAGDEVLGNGSPAFNSISQ